MLPTREWTAMLQLFCSLLLVLPGSTSVLNYQKEYEYVYRLNSTIELAEVQKFFAKAEVGFVNIAEDAYGIELLLIVHHAIIYPEGQPDVNGYHHDYSKWFSFLISRRGEISKVFHPPDEEEEVIILKKGFAGMLSAKFHHQHEIEHEVHADSWSYKTEEIGREGQHNSSYYVRTSPLGVEYTKIRTSNHTISINGNSTYSKRITVDKDLNTIHSVMMEESFKMDFSTQDRFSPHAGMRPIQAVNEFSELGLPGVFAYTADYFVFVKTVPFSYDQQRPQLLNNSTIHHVPKAS